MKRPQDVKEVVIRLVQEDAMDVSTHALAHARIHVRDVSTHVRIIARTLVKRQTIIRFLFDVNDLTKECNYIISA